MIMKINRAYQFRLYTTKEQKMKDIGIREFKCSKCGLEIERDYNASINILKEGLKSYNN